MKTLKNLWNGSVDYFYTYWVYYWWVLSIFIILSISFETVYPWFGNYRPGTTGFDPTVNYPQPPGVSIAAYLIILILGLVWRAFMCVSIWRSSNRYEGRKLWVNLGKMNVVIVTIENLTLLLVITNIFIAIS